MVTELLHYLLHYDSTSCQGQIHFGKLPADGALGLAAYSAGAEVAELSCVAIFGLRMCGILFDESILLLKQSLKIMYFDTLK